MNGTWKTTGGGGSLALLVVAVAVIAAAAAGPVLHAVGELLRVVLIAAGVLAGLVLAGAGVALTIAWRHGRRPGLPRVLVHAQPPPRPVQRHAQALPPPQVHLHLHGPVSAADVAAIVAQHTRQLEEDHPSC